MAGTSRPPQPGSVVSVHRSLGHLLDDDLHTLCLSFLSARDLLSALCVSQRWRSLERQHLWRALIRKDYPHLYVEHMHRLSLTAKMQYRQFWDSLTTQQIGYRIHFQNVRINCTQDTEIFDATSCHRENYFHIPCKPSWTTRQRPYNYQL